jgi:O-antigen/teichoic acid export membrane protein
MKPFLRLWIGTGFAEIAAPVGQLLLIGVWINSLAWVPLGLLQGQGRPAIVAKLHALELVPYVAILWIGMAWAGLPGAAWAWVLRVAIDALLMFWVSGLLSRVSFALSIGMALITAVEPTLQFTAEMPIIQGISATALLIAAAFYSVQVLPNDLRLMLTRVGPLLSSRLAEMLK